MPNSWSSPPIDWSLPPGRTDWSVGTGATAVERTLALACAAAGAVAVAVTVPDGVDWRWWQWVVVLVLAVDVVGGVAANGLSTAKRLYHSPPADGAGAVVRLVHHPVGFSALHVHPFVVAAVLPGGGWGWALAWYLACVGATALVVAVPPYLQRPAALAVVALLLVLAPLGPPPDGLQWFGPVLALKLVLAHAVREEPYRPGPLTSTTQPSAA